MADFRLLPFDPGDDAQASFVYDTFRRSTCGVATGHREHAQYPGQWPYNEMDRGRLMGRLKRELATPGTVTRLIAPTVTAAQAAGAPLDSWLGWIAVRAARRQVVYAFVKYRSRREGVATTAAIELGVDFTTGPVGVRFWTAATARIAADRPVYNLFADTRDAHEDQPNHVSTSDRDPGHRPIGHRAGRHPA